jgi:hypothetical protein
MIVIEGALLKFATVDHFSSTDRGLASRGNITPRCHSERSKESLFDLDARKEGFLASLGMTVF